VYDLEDYLAMVDDRVRTTAYLDAMRATIRPGDHVLELGTGFGYFAVQACLMGAAHVHAIEPNDAIALGPRFAAANGCADRITFVQQVSHRVTLPRRADLLIEDLRGISALHRGRLGAIADAHRRLLIPSARSIPRRDLLICAPAEWPKAARPHPAMAPATLHGVDVATVREADLQAARRSRGAPEQLLAPGATWAALDLDGSTGTEISGEGRFTCDRAGRFAAVSCWFSTELAEGIGFDTAPASPPTMYDRMLLPLPRAIDVGPGDDIAMTLRATFDGADYVWSWQVAIRSAGTRGAVELSGSTLGASLMSASRRGRRAASHVPVESGEVRALRTLTAAVDGVASLEMIASRVAAEHPALFERPRDALRWVAEQLAVLEEGSGD
jgi:hypothetical protein